MKKCINAPEAYVRELVEGIIAAHGDKLCLGGGNFRIVLTAKPKPGKVAIVTGGGSGHLPLFLGYVGEGLADGCAVGNVFASPSSADMYETIKAADNGAGTLLLFGNYGGDRMNFEMAAELAGMDDIRTVTLLGADDVASAPSDQAEKRRGVAGLIFAYKIAGACAVEMKSLDEVAEVTQKALGSIRSMGVAFSSCIVPEVGKPTFEISDDEIEIGMGIHGEPGISRSKMITADEIAAILVEKIASDLPFEAGSEAAVMINGLGSTPADELYIFFRAAAAELKEKGISIYRAYVGEFATSMEMAGLSVSLMRMDEQLKRYLDAPCNSPFFVQV